MEILSVEHPKIIPRIKRNLSQWNRYLSTSVVLTTSFHIWREVTSSSSTLCLGFNCCMLYFGFDLHLYALCMPPLSRPPCWVLSYFIEFSSLGGSVLAHLIPLRPSLINCVVADEIPISLLSHRWHTLSTLAQSSVRPICTIIIVELDSNGLPFISIDRIYKQ